MTETHRFEARLRSSGRGGGTLLDVPADVSATFGRRGRVPVRASLNGVAFRSSLMPMGNGRHCLGVTKAQLAEAGVALGNQVVVELALDDEPRVVTPPEDLRTALAHAPEASAAFERLSYTHQREYARWVDEARRAETRHRRIARTIQMLRDGVKHP